MSRSAEPIQASPPRLVRPAVALAVAVALGLTACSGCSTKQAPAGASAPIVIATAPRGATSATSATAGPEPREIATRSSLELSGIAWAPTLGKYLVVSDDVTEGARRHLPWIFALSPGGELDPSPLVVQGFDELNDMESICAGPDAGPDGTFFVTTSHSRNKKGRAPASRRRLLHVALRGRTLVVLGEVDLTEARTTRGRAPWDPDEPDLDHATSTLDVEALAYRADGLYIGLKAPLTKDGAATLLRLADPVVTLAGRALPAGAVTLWANVRLCPGPSAEACAGVSDMVFRDDGSLLLLGNTPKGASTPDQGGALWSLPALAAATSAPVPAARAATLVRRFLGLKPEGITLISGGSAALIVFDRDTRQPMWVTWPL